MSLTPACIKTPFQSSPYCPIIWGLTTSQPKEGAYDQAPEVAATLIILPIYWLYNMFTLFILTLRSLPSYELQPEQPPTKKQRKQSKR